MSRITWGDVGERFYETGVDRGVLYVGMNPGVPWNGLSSIEESPDGGGSEPFYIDGFKHLNAVEAEEFVATINAYSAPIEFLSCDGSSQISNGLFATQQPRRPFGLCYRTRIGNDVEGLDHGYKLHLVYGAIASPTSRENATLSDDSEPMEMSWEITTSPPRMRGFKPTAHFVIDSTMTDPALLGFIEGYLYGAAGVIPRLLTQQQLVSLFNNWNSSGGLNFPVNYKGLWGNASKDSVVNLATNPSFEATSGTVEVWRNLATNPSFETTDGTVEVWRNVVSQPTPSIPNSRWAATSVFGQTWELQIGFGDEPDVWAKATAALENIAVGAIYAGAASKSIPVTPGVETRFSIMGTTSDPGIRWHVRVRFTKEDGVSTTDTMSTTFGPAAGEGWSRQSLVLTPPADAAFASVDAFVNARTWSIGEWIGASKAMAGVPFGPEYLDGSYSPDPDLTPSWTGPVNNSESVLTGQQIAGVQGGNGRISIRSGTAGDRLLRTIRLAGTTSLQSSYGARVFNEPAGWVGKTFTVIAKCIIPEGYDPTGDVTTGSGARSRTIFDFGQPATVNSGPAPATPGTHELRLVCPPRTGIRRIQLGGTGGPIGQSIYWDDLLIVEGEYTGPYFDGSTSPDPDLVPSWTGTANASESVLTGEVVRGVIHSNTIQYQSKKWTRSKGNSLALFGQGAGAIISSLALEPGKTYTATAWAYYPLEGASYGPYSRRISVLATGMAIQYSERLPLSFVGWHFFKHTFTIPADVTNISLRLGDGGLLGVVSAHWDDLVIVEGEYTGPYFDGDSKNAIYMSQEGRYFWNGATNSSTSTMEVYQPLPSSPQQGDAWSIEGWMYIWNGEYWLRELALPTI